MAELWLSTTLYVDNGVVGCHLSKVVKVLFAKLNPLLKSEPCSFLYCCRAVL